MLTYLRKRKASITLSPAPPSTSPKNQPPSPMGLSGPVQRAQNHVQKSVSVVLPPSVSRKSSAHRPRISEDYDSSSSVESGDTARTSPQLPNRSLTKGTSHRPKFLLTPTLPSGRSSLSSTAASSPQPSRSGSPLPQFFSINQSSSSCSSDTDTESTSPLHTSWWGGDRRRWWSGSRRNRKRDGVVLRTTRKWYRKITRHPCFPRQPTTIASLCSYMNHL